MSLINEALKKAQKQRADEAAAQSGSVPPPGLGGIGAAPPAPPRPPKAPAAGGSFGGGASSRPDPLVVARTQRDNGGIGRLALITVLILTVGGAAVWWLRSGAEPEAASAVASIKEPAPANVTTAEVVEPSETIAEPQIVVPTAMPEPVEPAAPIPSASVAIEPAPMPTPSAPQPAVAFVAPVIQDPAPDATVQPERVRDLPARAAAGGLTILTDAEAEYSARVEHAPTTSSQPSEAVLRFLERSKVTGVRVSATDPKVLMNDRVYRIGDVIDRDLQLRVISIDTRELKFRDTEGHVYTKAF